MSESQKMGNVMKCPSCGAPYQPGTGACPECGHVFQNKEQLRSSIIFSNGLQEITSKYSQKAEENDSLNLLKQGQKWQTLRDREYAEKMEYIKTFFVPTSKDDLMEFMLTMAALRDNCGATDFLHGAYKSKIKECVLKAKAIYGNDPQMMSVVETVSKDKSVSPTKKIVAGVAILWGIIILLALILSLL